MNSDKTQYAVLRDHRNWHRVTMTGLQSKQDGVLTLARIPGTADGQPLSYPRPFDVEASGLAIGDCKNSYASDTDNDRLIGTDDVCESGFVLPGTGSGGSAPGQFKQPRGLLVSKDSLFVADSGNSRVQVFLLPTLELRAVWNGLLHVPSVLASDHQSRVYVLDRGLRRVLRFSARGEVDDEYNATMLSHQNLTSPFSLAIDNQDTLYVTDDQSNRVLHFDATGAPLGLLQKNDALVHPRALAAHANQLYVADADSGRIWVFDCKAEVYLGAISDYRGPVAAMIVDAAGSLHVKPRSDETVHHLRSDAACVSTGTLTSRRLDAGQQSEWARVTVEADVPAGTEVTLQTFVSDNSTANPTQSDWKNAPALDALIPPLPGNGHSPVKRFLWLRVILKSDNRMSPRLLQVQAETASETYLHHLPAVYSREDAEQRFLERWLAMFRSQLGDWELSLENMPRRFNPATTPEDHLQWLSTWLGFELPAGEDVADWRRLLQRAYELNGRRGTPSGIRDFVKLYTGVRPKIFEAFRERRVWQLGETSALGFDTALSPGSPEGMIIPGLTLADPQYLGLRGEYYDGVDFAQHKKTVTDSTIDFEWGSDSPDFSVRWTGQMQPRYSETYTFYTYTSDGVRLWVDGLKIIDKWVGQAPTEHSGKITLTADRWYSIMVEYYHRELRHRLGFSTTAVAKLSWLSRSQQKEVIPQSRLYSVRDENAQVEMTRPDSETEIVLVGETVVGQSGPLGTSEFGMPLFSETAHLFTVSVPAGLVPEPDQREALRSVVESEKPAHTDFHLCFPEAWMRVGFQAQIGIDTIIAGSPPPMALAGSWLGLSSYLGSTDQDDRTGRVGKQARLGRDTLIT